MSIARRDNKSTGKNFASGCRCAVKRSNGAQLDQTPRSGAWLSRKFALKSGDGMEIGTKLKNARTKNGLTQEKVAEEIGVSRQSVSNWENGRSYPDIVSVIKLSDLYSVSLDELLKEDKKMIKHLDEATNTVKSRRRFSRLIEIGIYLVIWATVVILFNVMAGISEKNAWDLIGYVWVAYYLVLPAATLVVSLFIGLEKDKARWLLVLFFGAMYMLAWFASVEVGRIDHYDLWTVMEQFDFTAFFAGGVFSVVGMGIGALIRFFKDRKKSGKTENDNSPGRAGA